MKDKTCTAADVVAQLRDGMTIGIGGWGSRRKPMDLVRAILRSPLRDLTVVSYAGPDLGLLCAAGKVKRAIYGFASLDSIPLEPWFRRARQAGQIEAVELDEGMLWLGLQAAARRLPFAVTRAGLGSDVMAINPWLKTVRSPYGDTPPWAGASGEGEELVAIPAIRLDAALIHLHRADCGGNAVYLNADPYFDDLFAGAADRCFLSCEQVVPTAQLAALAPPQAMLVSRMQVAGVVEAPGGAGFTECLPDYPRDEALQKRYAATAKDPALWDAFVTEWIDGGAA
ncbi:MAG: CoA-transferase [Myxococcota bacterium]|nr:CoA-transferase [Myxococcota bacterium]